MIRKATGLLLAAVLTISCTVVGLMPDVSANGQFSCTQDFETVTVVNGRNVRLENNVGQNGGKAAVFKGKTAADQGLLAPVTDDAQPYITSGKSYTVSYDLYLNTAAGKPVFASWSGMRLCYWETASAAEWPASGKFNDIPKNNTVLYGDLAENTWVHVEKTFTVDAGITAGYLILKSDCWAQSNDEKFTLYLDNFTVKELPGAVISFETNGGDELSPISAPAGSVLNLPTPKKQNAVFEHWCVDKDLTQRYTETVFPAQSLTLYAKWKNPPVSITEDFENLTEVNGVNCTIAGGKGQNGSKALSFHGSDGANMGLFWPTPKTATGYLEQGKSYRISYKIYLDVSNGRPDFASWSSMMLYYSNSPYLSGKFPSNSLPQDTIVYYKDLLENQWVTITKYISLNEVPAGNYILFRSNCYANNASDDKFQLYLDQIAIQEVDSVKINFETNGGNSIQPIIGVAGQTIPTLPLPTKADYSFAGWYTNAELTVPFTAETFANTDYTLYAKWNSAGSWVQGFESYRATNNMLSKSFSIYTKNSAADDNVKSGSKSLLRKSGGKNEFAVIECNSKLTGSKCYQADFWIKVSESDGNGQLIFTYLTDRTDAASWGAERRQKLVIDFSLKENENLKNGQWQKISFKFAAPLDCYLGVYSWGQNISFYLDDFSVTEIPGATICFEPNGGSAVESLSGVPEATVEELPVTRRTGFAFAGWYTDTALTQPFNMKFPSPGETVTLYAKWNEKGKWYQNFEGGMAERDSNFVRYHKQNAQDDNVYEGQYSLHRKIAPSTFSVLFPYGDKLESGTTYKIEFYYKATKYESAGAIDLTFLTSSLNPYSWGDERRSMEMVNINNDNVYDYIRPAWNKGWTKYSGIFTAEYDLAMGLYCWGGVEFYIDAVSVTKLDPGLLESDYSETYCYDLYNDILGVTTNAELNTETPVPRVLKMSLRANGDYIFAANIAAGSNAWVALAWDENGVDIIPGTKLTAGAVRNGKRVLLDAAGEVYFVYYNPQGSNAFSEVVLCEKLKTLLKQPSRELPFGQSVKNADGLPLLSNFLKQEKYADAMGLTIGNGTEEETTPATGDPSWPASFAVVCSFAAGAAIICIKCKGGKKHA